ncbi:MAG: 4-hydroxythreonine-4-phosphate dehydrogenase PdxA, partial [Bacteroidales bacterium]|nr:4-hydroxythreonine-4-phosphate dehydrogenase PdxA [Bacteroidales bacterium]
MAKIKIGFTPGDINGIGYEVILKSLIDLKNIPNSITIIYGSPKVLAYYKKNLASNVNTTTINKAEEAKNSGIYVINCNSDEIRVEIGKSTEMAGLASYQPLEKACADLKNKEIDLLVTGPINKWNIQSAGFNFPGHTEYLAQQFGTDKYLMLMCSESLRVGVATGHIPISDVSKNLSVEMLVEKLEILNKSLMRDFVIRKPRIAVLGLNPHCGDHG